MFCFEKSHKIKYNFSIFDLYFRWMRFAEFLKINCKLRKTEKEIIVCQISILFLMNDGQWRCLFIKLFCEVVVFF